MKTLSFVSVLFVILTSSFAGAAGNQEYNAADPNVGMGRDGAYVPFVTTTGVSPQNPDSCDICSMSAAKILDKTAVGSEGSVGSETKGTK